MHLTRQPIFCTFFSLRRNASHPRWGVADFRVKAPAYAGWTPSTPELLPSFCLSPAARRSRQKFTRPPSGSRLTNPKIYGAGRTCRRSEAASDFAVGQPLAFSSFDGGPGHQKSPRWGVALSSHTQGRVRCPSGAVHFPLGRKDAGIQGGKLDAIPLNVNEPFNARALPVSRSSRGLNVTPLLSSAIIGNVLCTVTI